MKDFVIGVLTVAVFGAMKVFVMSAFIAAVIYMTAMMLNAVGFF